jgi:uncharacterized protein (TIGR03435 family)
MEVYTSEVKPLRLRKFQQIAKAGFVAAILAVAASGQVVHSFEVASIRPNRSGSTNTNITLKEGGRFEVVNATLKTLIRNAYGILAFQLKGGPAWMDTEYYDIEAKTERPDELSNETLPLLLQDLLADRFRLKAHWETQEGSVYALTVDKDGPKFGPSVSSGHPGMNTSKGLGHGKMIGTKQPIEKLASNLGNRLGRFVLDQTGLQGDYDFSFEWDPDQTGDSPGPSIFTALREQLGLRLESQKGPMRVLVIDSAEKASQN